jgi:uncharacterized protein YdeI (YjbR/CyaY-like superfamily)
MAATYFRSAEEWRAWLEKHHAKETELLLGFYKAASPNAKDGLSRKDAVDEALCFGWIDGRVTGAGDERYTIRFTPRRKGSIWSAVNLRRIEELITMKRVAPSGLATYRNRDPKKEKTYSFENAPRELDAAQTKKLRANKKAWLFFTASAPSYQRVVAHWIQTAKKEETRAKRLGELIACSAKGELIPAVSKWKKKK